MNKLLHQFQILLVSPHTSYRSGLRKTLLDMGGNNHHIEVAGNFETAKERLEKNPVNILITDDELSESENGLDLLELHLKNNPDSRRRIFILMTNQTSPFLMADFVLKGGDSIINKPFKNETLINSVSGLLTEKENIKQEEGLVLDIQDALRRNDILQAESFISKFHNPESLEARYSKAIILEANNQFDEAFGLYARVIKDKPNFKSLVSILKIGMVTKKYSELSEFLEIWLKKFPIHHSSIPDMTKAIVLNTKYNLLDDLFQVFTQHKIEDKFARSSLAAGFVIASMCCLESVDNQKAKIYALKGIEYSCARFPILLRAMEILIKIGEAHEGIKAYNKLGDILHTTEGKIFELKVLELIQPKNQVLVECQKLLKQKIVDPDLYRITINCLRAIGKSTEEVMTLARKNFPDQSF